MDKFLSSGITRKQYILLLLFGIIFSPILFILGLFMALPLINANLLDHYPMLGLLVSIIAFGPIGIYFYILKVKRLNDLGYKHDAFGIYKVPYNGLLLPLMLLVKKSAKLPKNKRGKTVTDTYFRSLTDKAAIFVIFVIVNWLILYYIGADEGMQDWQHGYFTELPGYIAYQYGVNKYILFAESLYFITKFLVLPYFYSYFFRLLFNKWKK